MSELAEDERSHQKCRKAGQHVCRKASGRVCIERGCNEAAGTWWGPMWCPEHDAERLDNCTRGLLEALASSSPAVSS